MKLSSSFLVLLILGGLTSCDKFKITTTEEGDRLIIHEKGKSGKTAKEGDFLTFDMVIKSSTDSVLKDSYKDGQPLMMPLQKGQFKGSFESGLAHIGEGDSTTVLVSADSLFTMMNQPFPPGISKGTDLKFTVKMRKVQTQEEFQKEIADKKANEGKYIEDYVNKSLKGAVKTPEGLYYSEKTAGNGATPAKGDTVVVSYVGKFLDGKEFDKSELGQPFSFPVGMGYVIPGWDKALMMMKPGSKRTFVTPSTLAYGEQGAGGVIPPNTPLVFDIELVSVKK